MVKTERNAAVTLGSGVSTLISEAQTTQKRSVILITNLEAAGGATCFICVGVEAKINIGIPLVAGQSLVFSKDAGYSPSNKRISAYCNSSINVAIYEELD